MGLNTFFSQEFYISVNNFFALANFKQDVVLVNDMKQMMIVYRNPSKKTS